MIVKRILIEYANITEKDILTCPDDDKRIEFIDIQGWRTSGPLFPNDIKLMSILSDFLKEGWRTHKGMPRLGEKNET